MARYESTKITKSRLKGVKKLSNKFNTTIYDKVEELDSDLYVITQEGDRLDNLATLFYGDPTYWWFIAHVNNLSTMNVEPGIRLRISFDMEKATTILDKSI